MSQQQAPQWAMATPGIVYTVATACVMLFALLAGLVGPGAIPVLGVTFMFGAVTCIAGSFVELRRGDILLGSICLVFGCLIFGAVGTVLLIAALVPGVDLRAAAYLAFGIAVCLLLFLPGVGKVSWLLFVSFIILAAAAVLLAIGILTGVPFGLGIMFISGILFLIFGVIVYYLGTVFIVNTVYGAPKLSPGAPIFK